MSEPAVILPGCWKASVLKDVRAPDSAKEQGSRAQSINTFHTTSKEWANYMLARSVPAC
jgi:hypothetical protein